LGASPQAVADGAGCDGGESGAAAAGGTSRYGLWLAVWRWPTAGGSLAPARTGSGLRGASADHPRGQGQQRPRHGVPKEPDGSAPDPSSGGAERLHRLDLAAGWGLRSWDGCDTSIRSHLKLPFQLNC
jgi:hypothetical protein